MPASPRTPVPSSSRMTSVSAWSSAVCPSAIRAAPWTRSTSAARQATPDLAVLEVLLLPPRDGALEGVDRIAARLEGVAAVRGRPRDEHRRLADLEPADAVEYRHAPHARPARADRAADLAHLRLGHGRVRLVLEELHRAPVGLVADDAGEDDDAAGAGIVHGLRDGVGGERAIDDGEDVVGHFTARPNGLRLTLAFSTISPLASAIERPAARTGMFDHCTARLAGGTGSARTAAHRREQAQIDNGGDVIGMFDHFTARLAGGTGSARLDY